jgi:hypothetical protein
MTLSVQEQSQPSGSLTVSGSGTSGTNFTGNVVPSASWGVSDWQNMGPGGGYVANFQPATSTSQQTGVQQTSGGGGGGGYDPAAAQAAEDAAKRAQLQSGIKKLIGDTLGVYDSLYGDVRKAATSQRQALDKRYNREVGSLTDQFNTELPKIGRGYAGRGAFDSSYRMDAEAGAQKGFENQITDIGQQRQADAAKIGQYQTEQEAQFGAGQGLLRTVQSRLPETQDVNELMQLRNDIEKRMSELQAARGSNQSQEAYVQKFGQLAPAGDRLGQLQSTLTNIVNGQAPGPLKRAVAQQIIGSAGLSKDDQARLLNQVNTQIG